MHFDDLLRIDRHLFRRLEGHCDGNFRLQVGNDLDWIDDGFRISLSG